MMTEKTMFTSAPPFTGAGPSEMPPEYFPPTKSVLEYLLAIEVPEKYKEDYDRFRPMLSQSLALAYIRREDIPKYKTMLSLIFDYYKIGLPEMARKRIIEMVVDLMLTRSVDGFQQIMIKTTRTEQMYEGLNLPGVKEKEKKGFSLFKWRRGEK